jgi:hypothetical protein
MSRYAVHVTFTLAAAWVVVLVVLITNASG